MEPTLPSPHGSPEVRPPVLGPERGESVVPADTQTPERQESREQKASGDGSQPAAVIAPQPAAPATPVIRDTPPVANPVVDDSSPATAADDDLIEKEWVEKAKQVIAENRNDPYMQERAVSRLQAAYLQKRYGKTIKLPEEG